MRVPRRERLRQQYDFRCGYCGVSETDTGAQLTIDHFRPTARGGSNELANLVYCCHACNEFKGEFWNPGAEQRILHLLNDDISQHIEQVEDTLRGVTPTGTFHINRLRLNRAELVAYRRDHRLRAEQAASVATETERLEAAFQKSEAKLRQLRRKRRA